MSEKFETMTFCGVTFRVVRVSPTYTKLVPLDDPDWLVRYARDNMKGSKDA